MYPYPRCSLFFPPEFGLRRVSKVGWPRSFLVFMDGKLFMTGYGSHLTDCIDPRAKVIAGGLKRKS
jgi:hypothetical protein